ncbi:MAG TPA: PhzF family phenazine biosynthesis protein [Paracoccaceae bacterium]|nr:PhzF family phenazine biosynthesis protein [Paracoccaceae bacterium]
MTALTMYQVDAFAERPFAGNPAAVLILDRPMDARMMQAIASENNLAETAFALRDADGWQIRWFTPVHEAAFCGHATLATAHVLFSAYQVNAPMQFQTRKVGTLSVTRRRDGRYEMDLPAIRPEPAGDLPAEFARLFPEGPRNVTRNFENFFVELASPDAVRAYVPDLATIARLHPMGLAITARGGETHQGRPVDFLSRYFAPGAGIDEDPVTGSIHATLVPYWAERLGKTELSAFQASARGGELDCRLVGDRVQLIGSAVTYMRATIFPA